MPYVIKRVVDGAYVNISRRSTRPTYRTSIDKVRVYTRKVDAENSIARCFSWGHWIEGRRREGVEAVPIKLVEV